MVAYPPRQQILGETFRSCGWCGEAVTQLGTRSPRLYCKRSHRQRALEARRLGQPMKWQRPPEDEEQASAGGPAGP